MIWKVCSIQNRRGKKEQICFGQRKCQIVPHFSPYFQLDSDQWRFYSADLSKGYLFEYFTCICFGIGRLLLHLTLRVEHRSSYLGRTRLNWQGWLYSAFGAHEIVIIPTFGLPIESEWIEAPIHYNPHWSRFNSFCSKNIFWSEWYPRHQQRISIE